MAPAYKLTYFNGRGAGECIRFLFKYGKIEFEDNRIKVEDWPQLKNSTPFGQLPYLERNGKVVSQSKAIARYVGKLVNLAGNTELEDLEIDFIADTITDMLLKINVYIKETNEETKTTLKNTFVNETLPFYLARLEKIAIKNKGYLALGRLTWIDLCFATYSSIFDGESKNVFEKYPTLEKLIETVHKLPAIEKWIKQRPETPF